MHGIYTMHVLDTVTEWLRLEVYIPPAEHRDESVRTLRTPHRVALDAHFERNNRCAFNFGDLSNLITENRATWGFAKSWSIRYISRILLEGGWLQTVSLTSDLYRPKTRFASRLASRFQIALSIKKGSYLSHGTAASLHALNETNPTTTYVNKEQSPKNSTRNLSQEGIDRAFHRLPRESKYRFWQMDLQNPIQYVLLNGKASHDFGVEWMEHAEFGRLRLSNLERTLVDLAVRPHYSDGASSVLNAYFSAKARVDVRRLVFTLEQLDFAYPYHQSIGFLMARAGFEPSDYELFKRLGLKYDFYLTHGMTNPSYDSHWRLYYPRDL
jgi:predicted transcriptional regulator of viral defense system